MQFITIYETSAFKFTLMKGTMEHRGKIRGRKLKTKCDYCEGLVSSLILVGIRIWKGEMTLLDPICLVNYNVKQSCYKSCSHLGTRFSCILRFCPLLLVWVPLQSVSTQDMVLCCVWTKVGLVVCHFDSYSIGENQSHGDLESWESKNHT